MAGLGASDRKQLEKVVAGRLGARSDAKVLVQAYLDAMERNAFFRTTDDGPVPTSLLAERSLILIEVSRQLGRVIEDFEIQALFRVTPTQSKSMRNALFAAFPDITNELSLTWSVVDAYQDGRKKGRLFAGTVIVFAARERREAFVAYAKRMGFGVEELLGDPERPWKVLVSDDFGTELLPK